MQSRVLVTAATGVLGKAIVEAGMKAGLPLRQGVRDLTKANSSVEAVRLDYADATTIAPALAGASAMILMAPPLDSDAPAKLAPVVEAAKTGGIRHIVLISAFGVNHNEQAPLRIVEHLVMNSGIPFTILRPNFLMENFSEGFLAPAIRKDHAIYLAAGDGKTSFISARDVATAAVTVLLRSRTDIALDLTGPAALDHNEAAAVVSQASGQTVTYHSLTEEAMLHGARSTGMPEPVVGYMGALYAVVRAGFAAPVTNDFETLTGRAPMSFENFAHAAAHAWR